MSQPYIPSDVIVDLKTGLMARSWLRLFQLIQQTFLKGDPVGAFFRWGTGDPEGVVTGPVSSVFMRTDGGASTSFYVKETGTGSTGWVGK
jgi:hypothetical protein